VAQTSSQSDKPGDRLRPILIFLKECSQEFYRGVVDNKIPWPACCGVGAVFAIVFVLRVDAILWRICHMGRMYPFHAFFYWSYATIFITSGFWLWTLGRVVARHQLIKRLTSVFRNAGLQTRTGRLPGFISDEQMDVHMRKLTLSSVGLPEIEFRKAKPFIETELQVFIDQIKSNVARGTVELLYAHNTLPEHVSFDSNLRGAPLRFMVGATRSVPLFVSLRDVPHILIGGYTNSGKSTFLRQVLVTLTYNSPGVEFTLIDLKRGLEFQYFEGLPGVKLYATVLDAIEALKYVEAQLEKRMLLLRANRCNDMDAYFRVPESKRVFTPEWPKERKVARHVVVIDEAAELFLASATLAAKDAQVARRLCAKIAALGRAVGIHLIIATQRPDKNAVDPLIKSNLQGRLCFQMADNASSMTILDAVRAADLPPIKGRAIWRSGMDLLEVQVPELKREDLEPLIQARKPKKVDESTAPKTEPDAQTPPTAAPKKDDVVAHDEMIKAETPAQPEATI
jgi:S-DNA-T family DNA segregation ATPase FtsK/SpoIIIE